jgi:hypothetical protein
VLPPGSCFVVEDILDAGSGLTIVQLVEDASMKLLKFQLPPASSSVSSSAAAASSLSSASSSSAAVGGGASHSLSDLSIPDVNLIVTAHGTDFEGYSAAITRSSFGGNVIDMLDVNDLAQMMESMGFSTHHKLVLKATFTSWKKNPDKAFEALASAKAKKLQQEAAATQKAQEEAAAAKKAQEQAAAAKKAQEQAAAAKKAQEQAAAAKKAEELRRAEELRKAEERRKAEAAEAERKAAAAPPPRSIVYNGNVYKSLADHDPHSTTEINESDKLFDLPSAWRICPRTPDAVHVCASYPWACSVLVFADGSAQFTAQKPYLAGQEAHGRVRLRQEGGRYGIVDTSFAIIDSSYSCCCDVLLVRKL